MANANDYGTDQYLDILEDIENARSEANLLTIKKEPTERKLEEKKEYFAADVQFEQNMNTTAQKVIRSANKSRPSNRNLHSVEGIEVELPRIKHHAMITRLDEFESPPEINLRSRSVVRSGYKYEHINSGSEVVKPRKLFPEETNVSSSNTYNIIDNEQIKSRYSSNQIQNNQNVYSNIASNRFQVPTKPPKNEVLCSPDEIQTIDSQEIGSSVLNVFENQLQTGPNPLILESRQSNAVELQNTRDTQQQCMFKARKATVLKIKPFVPKHEKKYTIPQNIHLSTERRAQEWMIFEQEIKVKMLHKEELLRKERAENKKNEMNLIKAMRRQSIHKPEPIKKYKPIVIQRSAKPVTVPHSPRFSTRFPRNCLNSVRD